MQPAAASIKINVFLAREGDILAAHCNLLGTLGVVQLVGSSTCKQTPTTGSVAQVRWSPTSIKLFKCKGVLVCLQMVQSSRSE